MLRANKELHQALSEANIRYWQVADKLKINDGNFSRLLRYELAREKQEEILKIIKELKNEGE